MFCMVTSSNGNTFRITGLLWGESIPYRWIPFTRPVTRSIEIYFVLRLNKRMRKESRHRWIETPWRSLWPQRNCDFHYSSTIQKGSKLRLWIMASQSIYHDMNYLSGTMIIGITETIAKQGPGTATNDVAFLLWISFWWYIRYHTVLTWFLGAGPCRTGVDTHVFIWVSHLPMSCRNLITGQVTRLSIH